MNRWDRGTIVKYAVFILTQFGYGSSFLIRRVSGRSWARKLAGYISLSENRTSLQNVRKSLTIRLVEISVNVYKSRDSDEKIVHQY